MGNPKRTPTKKPRIRIRDNGLAHLAGVHYDDLRSTFTQAALYCHEQLKKPGASDDHRSYYERRLRVLGMLSTAMDAGIVATHPRHDRQATRAERRARVQEDRRFRLLVEDLLDRRVPIGTLA